MPIARQYNFCSQICPIYGCTVSVWQYTPQINPPQTKISGTNGRRTNPKINLKSSHQSESIDINVQSSYSHCILKTITKNNNMGDGNEWKWLWFIRVNKTQVAQNTQDSRQNNKNNVLLWSYWARLGMPHIEYLPLTVIVLAHWEQKTAKFWDKSLLLWLWIRPGNIFDNENESWLETRMVIDWRDTLTEHERGL